MRDALLLSLQEFLGAVVLVSHDRGLLGGVCDEFLRVRDGEVETFDGDLDDYARWLATTRRGADGVATVSNAEPPALDRKERKRLEAEARNRLAPQRAELKRVERELEVCLAERQTLEARLADPALYASADPAVRALPAAHAALLTRIHDLEERWLMLSEELGQ
jgi:ATP-binding cassette subfamily F protein 3